MIISSAQFTSESSQWQRAAVMTPSRGLWAVDVQPFFPSAELDGPRHITPAVEVRLSQLCVIISHLTQRERLVWNMNEDDKNSEITANRSLVPERIINASTPINILAERSPTHHNYLVCGLFASSHLQAGNSLPFRGESLQHVLNISQRVAGL